MWSARPDERPQECQLHDRYPAAIAPACGNPTKVCQMPSHDVSQTSASRSLVVPDCTNCHRADRVREGGLEGVSPGVQYWQCDGCRFVWATRDSEDLGASCVL